MKLFAALIISTAFAAASAQPSFAQEYDAARSVTVNIADLNMSTDAGMQVAWNRISAAATQVCEPGGPELAALAEYRRCRAGAIDSAVRAANSPRLTAYAGGRADTIKLARNDKR